jgi:hypothetical protein
MRAMPRTSRLQTLALYATVSLTGAGLLAACATNPNRLPHLDHQFYKNLPSKADREAFLRLKSSERQAFLEEKGLWSKWKELNGEERDGVKSGVVTAGFKVFAAHMAWGPPAIVEPVDKGTRHVEFETYIRCTSGPNTGEYAPSMTWCDGTSNEVQIAVESGVITEVKFLD